MISHLNVSRRSLRIASAATTGAVEPAATTAVATTAAATTAPAEPTTPPAATGNSFEVVSNHEPLKPGDPVVVKFPNVTVKSAVFTDVENLTGGTAELEVDVATLSSGAADRDKHLLNPDFFEAALNPKITIKVTEVKKVEGDQYSAKAEVTAHGVTATLPVNFKVVEKTATGVKVEGEHKFNRAEFKIGKTVAEGNGVADEVTVKLSLLLNKPANTP